MAHHRFTTIFKKKKGGRGVFACGFVYKLGGCCILQDKGDHLIPIQTVLQH